MTEWYPIHAKFTKSEIDAISKYMKKYKLKTRSKFIRKAVEELIGISLLDRQPIEKIMPTEVALALFFKASFKKLSEFPEITPRLLKKYDKFSERWIIRYASPNLRKLKEDRDKIEKIYDKFREHGKIGRPKAPKGKKGRPANRTRGYDNKRF